MFTTWSGKTPQRPSIIMATTRLLRPILISFFCVVAVSGFYTNVLRRVEQSSPLPMAPKYNSETSRWTPGSPDEEVSAGYPPFGSLLRQGPSPFIQRILNPDDYDQGVLKMMASEGMSRNEAQGNMDAYIRNVRQSSAHFLARTINHMSLINPACSL